MKSVIHTLNNLRNTLHHQVDVDNQFYHSFFVQFHPSILFLLCITFVVLLVVFFLFVCFIFFKSLNSFTSKGTGNMFYFSIFQNPMSHLIFNKCHHLFEQTDIVVAAKSRLSPTALHVVATYSNWSLQNAFCALKCYEGNISYEMWFKSYMNLLFLVHD